MEQFSWRYILCTAVWMSTIYKTCSTTWVQYTPDKTRQDKTRQDTYFVFWFENTILQQPSHIFTSKCKRWPIKKDFNEWMCTLVRRTEEHRLQLTDPISSNNPVISYLTFSDKLMMIFTSKCNRWPIKKDLRREVYSCVEETPVPARLERRPKSILAKRMTYFGILCNFKFDLVADF